MHRVFLEQGYRRLSLVPEVGIEDIERRIVLLLPGITREVVQADFDLVAVVVFTTLEPRAPEALAERLVGPLVESRPAVEEP